MPAAALADLRRRLAETRLPEKETVADQSQVVPLKTVQQLLHQWQTDRNVSTTLIHPGSSFRLGTAGLGSVS